MVLAVCRGILKDPDDAQDAFQATFLVLIRRAGSLWSIKGSLASWLYRVAQRIAIRAKVESARRRTIEARAGRRSVSPNTEPEAISALHEEIGRLPERFRAPIVLCHLQQLTHAQAARQLGWTTDTVRGRVARGRDLLRSRLARRGAIPAVGGLAALLPERQILAAVPRSWVEAGVQAAAKISAGEAIEAGTVSAAATAFSEEVLRVMGIHSLLKIAASALIGVTALAWGASAALVDGPSPAIELAQAPAKSPKPPKPAPKPVPKAGPADVPITGRIVDLEGRPVPGVAVRIEEMTRPKGDNLDAWLAGVKKGEPPWDAYGHLINEEIKVDKDRVAATTDKDGRFRLDGLGGERVVELRFQGDSIVYMAFTVVTRAMRPLPAKGFENQYGSGTRTIYGADFTLTAAPSRPIEGVLKDAETGEPLADAEVRSDRFPGSNFVGTGRLRTRSDARGRFRLLGMPKGTGNQILVVPNDEQPYFLHTAEVPDPPGMTPVKVEVALQRGIWIEGKLTEQATGKPVVGAWLHYFPYRSNRFAQANQEFGKGRLGGFVFQDRYLSKADGSFRLVGLPGRAIVGANVWHKSYLQGAGSESIPGMAKNGHFVTYDNPVMPGRHWPTVMKEIDPAADAKVVHVDLQVMNGASVRLKVVDADGKPVAGVATRGLAGRSSHEREPMKEAEDEVKGLYPDEERLVLLRHEGRKIGVVIRVRPGDDSKGPIVATLKPLAAITGRTANFDDSPVPAARIRPILLSSGSYPTILPEVVSDGEGRFRVPDVPTGCDYSLVVEAGTLRADRRVAFHKQLGVKPGETTDVGDVKFKKD
jgi:RNA polymerase sigma factor (sigma-70 family)